ncbi:hypothetical protein PR048_023294 [Dryococelus australis]|uniref:Uncharacterized protein n=1 Tax=Dryococelus australis TaxID=614101 RepID=A0ABQ9GTS0_9NEOP|nr:hypothetical protein PR048_023294 [Dryococelus australis]
MSFSTQLEMLCKANMASAPYWAQKPQELLKRGRVPPECHWALKPETWIVQISLPSLYPGNAAPASSAPLTVCRCLNGECRVVLLKDVGSAWFLCSRLFPGCGPAFGTDLPLARPCRECPRVVPKNLQAKQPRKQRQRLEVHTWSKGGGDGGEGVAVREGIEEGACSSASGSCIVDYDYSAEQKVWFTKLLYLTKRHILEISSSIVIVPNVSHSHIQFSILARHHTDARSPRTSLPLVALAATRCSDGSSLRGFRKPDLQGSQLTAEIQFAEGKERASSVRLIAAARRDLPLKIAADFSRERGSIPGQMTRFSHVGIVPDDAVCRRVFSGISRFPAPSLRRCSVLTSITLIGSQDLAVKSSPNLSKHFVLRLLARNGSYKLRALTAHHGAVSALFETIALSGTRKCIPPSNLSSARNSSSCRAVSTQEPNVQVHRISYELMSLGALFLSYKTYVHTLATSRAMLEVSAISRNACVPTPHHGLTKPLKYTWVKSNSCTGVIDTLFQDFDTLFLVVDDVNRRSSILTSITLITFADEMARSCKQALGLIGYCMLWKFPNWAGGRLPNAIVNMFVPAKVLAATYGRFFNASALHFQGDPITSRNPHKRWVGEGDKPAPPYAFYCSHFVEMDSLPHPLTHPPRGQGGLTPTVTIFISLLNHVDKTGAFGGEREIANKLDAVGSRSGNCFCLGGSSHWNFHGPQCQECTMMSSWSREKQPPPGTTAVACYVVEDRVHRCLALLVTVDGHAIVECIIHQFNARPQRPVCSHAAMMFRSHRLTRVHLLNVRHKAKHCVSLRDAGCDESLQRPVVPITVAATTTASGLDLRWDKPMSFGMSVGLPTNSSPEGTCQRAMNLGIRRRVAESGRSSRANPPTTVLTLCDGARAVCPRGYSNIALNPPSSSPCRPSPARITEVGASCLLGAGVLHHEQHSRLTASQPPTTLLRNFCVRGRQHGMRIREVRPKQNTSKSGSQAIKVVEYMFPHKMSFQERLHSRRTETNYDTSTETKTQVGVSEEALRLKLSRRRRFPNSR